MPSGLRAPLRSGVTTPTANSQTFKDAAGDNQGNSPDLTTVQVSNDDAGNLEFRIAFPNRSDFTDPDFVTVNVDADQSSLTGCDIGGGFGVDWALAFRGHTAPQPDSYNLGNFSTACKIDPATPQGSYAGTFDPTTMTLILRLNRSDIGNPSAFRFLVIANIGAVGPETWDLGGELSPWIYQILVSPPRDQTPPRVKGLASMGVHGGTAKLRYTVFDESGKTREEIKIRRGGRVLATKRVRLGPRSLTRIYAATWRVPPDLLGTLKFCVRAWDAAGNRSAPSCARLTIR
jgi:hypothetical protein